MVHYDSLLQNTTDFITKCDSYFITKCDRSLLQNESVFLLQNANVLLQKTTIITNCDDCTTECDVYYKLRQYDKKFKSFLKQTPEVSIKTFCRKWEGETLPLRFFIYKQLKNAKTNTILTI